MAETGEPAQEIHQLIRDLGKITPQLRKQLRPALKTAATPILADARGRAGWSRRVPGAISMSVRLSRRDPGVSLRVRQAIAPHGRPYEAIGGNRTFRHPLFGNRRRWVAQEARSYLAPALEAGVSGVLEAATQAVDQVAKEQGFR